MDSTQHAGGTESTGATACDPSIAGFDFFLNPWYDIDALTGDTPKRGLNMTENRDGDAGSDMEVRVVFRAPARLVKALDDTARAEMLTRSAVTRRLLASGLGLLGDRPTATRRAPTSR